MIDPELAARLDQLETKIDAAYKAAESARKQLFWSRVITIALFVLPLLGLAWLLPGFLRDYGAAYESLLGSF